MSADEISEKEVAIDAKQSQEIQQETAPTTGASETGNVKGGSPLTAEENTNQTNEEEKLVLVKTEPQHMSKSEEIKSIEILKKLETINEIR